MALIAMIPSGMTEITVNGLHQWDYGQQLEIHATDLPGLVEVHFAYAGMTDAVVRPCDMVGGVGTVAIPDACLEQTAPIMAWVYEKDGATGATVKTITLKVTPRARPTASAAPPPETIDQYTEAVTAMNEAVGKVADGRITAAKAERDLEGNKLVDNYHLNSITTGNPKFLKGPDVDIDKICMPSMCGVYTIDWTTIRDYDIPTLPDDMPTGKGAGKLIVEADYNVDGASSNTVFQTLKLRVQNTEANQQLMLWTRQCVDGAWSRWLRHVSAVELTEGTLLPAKAKADEQGKPLSKKINLGEHWVYDGYDPNVVDGYVRVATTTIQETIGTSTIGIIPSGGLIMFLIRCADGKTNAQVLMDTAQGAELYSGLFLLKSYVSDNYDHDSFKLKLTTTTPTDPSKPYQVRLIHPYIKSTSDGGYTFDDGYTVGFDDGYEVFYKYLAKY